MNNLTNASRVALKQGFHQIRHEMGDLAEILMARRRDRVRREVKYQLAALRFETALIRQAYRGRKAGFNQNQPRVPAGTQEGGRWTSDGSGVLGSPVMSDATPDPIIPGAQYAQTSINIDTSALTGISTIDDTTKQLANTLARVKDVVEYLPTLSPQRYGTEVHTAFAAAVRAQNLPGIAPSDVETTFGGGRYGAKDSVRTDVVLRNDVGDVIAIYDVKTGDKSIDPVRAARLRLKVGVGNEVPIFQMSFTDGITRKYAFFSAASVVQITLNYGG
jgi:hypothetical protein